VVGVSLKKDAEHPPRHVSVALCVESRVSAED